MLIANNALMPDPHTIATYVAAHTTRLKFLIAHRPGFIAPTAAARMLATVDRLSKGRVGVHIIAGPSDKELEADGDFLTKDERYARAREYVGILRRIWSSAEPIDHQGQYYRFNQAFAPIKPYQTPRPAGVLGGHLRCLGRCLRRSGRHLRDERRFAGQYPRRTRTAPTPPPPRHGRRLDHMMTVIVILGASEAEAWAKADKVLEEFIAMRDRLNPEAAKGPSNFAAASHAGERVLATAASGARHDRCLWMGVTEAAAGKFGNQTTLVGTARAGDRGTDGLLPDGRDALPDPGVSSGGGYCRIWPGPVPAAARGGGA